MDPTPPAGLAPLPGAEAESAASPARASTPLPTPRVSLARPRSAIVIKRIGPASTPEQSAASPAASPATPGPRKVPPSDADPLLGQLLDGRFEVLSKIGAGGMGSVYRARQVSVDREVALKVMQPEVATSSVAVSRFLAEARTASQLAHPNTVTIYDFGQGRDGRLYLAMELLNGKPLSRLIKEQGALPWTRALRIAIQLLGSLTEAHQKGFLHRDVKPDNIMLCDVSGNQDHVKVLDFGIAKSIGESASGLTVTGVIMGTPRYMSPEQAMTRELNFRSDLYSVGVILFEMLTGATPFTSDTPLGVMMMHCNQAPPDIRQTPTGPELPPLLCDLVDQLLAKSPEHRPASALEVKTRLEAILTGSRTSSAPALGAAGGPSARPDRGAGPPVRETSRAVAAIPPAGGPPMAAAAPPPAPTPIPQSRSGARGRVGLAPPPDDDPYAAPPPSPVLPRRQPAISATASRAAQPLPVEPPAPPPPALPSAPVVPADPAPADPRELAERLFASSPPGFFWGDDVPGNKLALAQRKWLFLEDDEELLFFIEASPSGDGSEGVAVTEQRVIWRQGPGMGTYIRLDGLRPDLLKKSGSRIAIDTESFDLDRRYSCIEPLFKYLQGIARK